MEEWLWRVVRKRFGTGDLRPMFGREFVFNFQDTRLNFRIVLNLSAGRIEPRATRVISSQR
jgi:hypothetical protein